MAPRIVPPALKAIEQETMADKVYQQLREALMSGRFAPGQALSLRSVAEAVGSSTMPVRAALTRLRAERALVDGPNRALVVPLVPLSLVTAYNYDFAYGSKPERNARLPPLMAAPLAAARRDR